ncbi:MAG: hypothetical protein Q4E67_07405 [Planctomycetia bacterium]|nr:hypothetical protein [Planctomycetia bacterium]MDO5114188.1 hypothetical protein [Planctomycetia bacterium]
MPETNLLNLAIEKSQEAQSASVDGVSISRRSLSDTANALINLDKHQREVAAAERGPFSSISVAQVCGREGR